MRRSSRRSVARPIAATIASCKHRVSILYCTTVHCTVPCTFAEDVIKRNTYRFISDTQCTSSLLYRCDSVALMFGCSEVSVPQRVSRGAAARLPVRRLRPSSSCRRRRTTHRRRLRRLRPAPHPRTRELTASASAADVCICYRSPITNRFTAVHGRVEQ